MTSDADYREIAHALRRLARRTRHFEVTRQLEYLADRFERMAEHAEQRREVEP